MTQAPAGWYPQPDGSQRWWDGAQWTDHVQSPPAAVTFGRPAPSTASSAQSGWFRPWVVVLSLVLFFPLGLFLMWKGGLWSPPARWAVTAVVAVLALIGAASSASEPAPTTPAAAPAQVLASPAATTANTPVDDTAADAAAAQAAASYSAQAQAQEDEAASRAEASKSADAEAAAEAAASKAAAAEAAKPKLTVSQENAIEKAEDYLDFEAFSKKGLIEQLRFEGFSKSDSNYAVNHIKVNWNQQAAKKAESYLDFTAFSRSGLIEQLEFEGFTPAQARYGASQNGL